ncbi:hypothetical protein DDE20_18600 [Pararhodobacter oceanensis]|uniref:Uncharacterized protein n=1 Tax=Pararhodobacter oceanensis TaxID=2172121 RepID=A0A2T8HP77_9RHOB|nr:hypothetical protein DDE20_18600 [Pararhodobacter oceanensis]
MPIHNASLSLNTVLTLNLLIIMPPEGFYIKQPQSLTLIYAKIESSGLVSKPPRIRQILANTRLYSKGL